MIGVTLCGNFIQIHPQPMATVLLHMLPWLDPSGLEFRFITRKYLLAQVFTDVKDGLPIYSGFRVVFSHLQRTFRSR